MSNLPMEEPQRIMEQMYLLVGKQVQSYHKHHHMGNHSSVPVELALELMKSIEYTVNLVGGAFAYKNVGEALTIGQKMLESKLLKAKSMLELINRTAPPWQTECRWEAIDYLRKYLEQYDHLHLAHKGPENLFYPILISPPEGIQGIDSCIFYLNILWIENQIMAGVPENALEHFWDRLPAATLNQCEHLLINGIGKVLIGANLDSLIFTSEEYVLLYRTMCQATEETLHAAANSLCQKLDLNQEDAIIYVTSTISQLLHWIGKHISLENLDNIFL